MKRTVVLFISLLAISSCGIFKNQPVQRDSTVIRYIDSLVVRDSIVYINIPKESSSQILPSTDSSHLETSIAKSDAWVDASGFLHHNLNNKAFEKLPVIVPLFDRKVISDEKQTITITKTVEKELSKWQNFKLKAFWWMFGIIAAILILKILHLVSYRL